MEPLRKNENVRVSSYLKVQRPRLIPELDVSDFDQSLHFYCILCGFQIDYQRPEERFAMLTREGSCLMIEEAKGPGRRFRTAVREKPFGRGVNLQIQVSDVEAMHDRILREGIETIVPLEERWYRADEVELGARQFVVADPDGYLLRFFGDLGSRPIGQQPKALDGPRPF